MIDENPQDANQHNVTNNNLIIFTCTTKANGWLENNIWPCSSSNLMFETIMSYKNTKQKHTNSFSVHTHTPTYSYTHEILRN